MWKIVFEKYFDKKGVLSRRNKIDCFEWISFDLYAYTYNIAQKILLHHSLVMHTLHIQVRLITLFTINY